MLANELLEEHKEYLDIYRRERERLLKNGKVSSKVKNKLKYHKCCIENIERNFDEINKLEKYKYYTVEISYGYCCSHKAIMWTNWNPSFVIIFNSSYEEKFKEIHIESIPYFKVLRELVEIND